MAEESKAAGPGGAGRKTQGPPPADMLKGLLESYLQMANLQNDYQSIYRSLPEVFAVAGEVLQKKEAGDDALQQGMAVVEKLLKDASTKAEKLSNDMQEQHAVLEKILADKTLLTEILRAGKQGVSGQSGGPGAALGQDNAKGQGAAGAVGAGYQPNTMMALQAMVSREVERQLASLRMQAEKVMQASK